MASKKNVKYKCPYCDKRYIREDLVRHVETKHDDMIPEGFTPFRLVFNYVNKKPQDYHGKCTECGGPTDWDENKGRYNRQCNNPKCKESFIKKFEANMIRTKGVTRISATAEGQEKMLANRKISGKYKFQNGVEKTYTGSYELKALEFMDKVMNISPDDILAPGPILEYEYEGKKHIYITDFYYQPYNLVIEVKDGGKRPNNRNMPDYRGKQIAKEKFIINNTNYNYLRLTDNDLSQLLSVMADLKMQMVENSGERVIHVNEGRNISLLKKNTDTIFEAAKISIKSLYHVSRTNLDGKTLNPSIPNNYFTKNGFEDNITSRVCFAPSIDKCLRGLSQNCTGMELYVHIPVGKFEPLKPNHSEVPDSKVTGEVWITKPVKVKCIGKIKVIGDKGEDGLPFKYGNNTAELYDWEWKWIDKYATESYLDKNNTIISEVNNALLSGYIPGMRDTGSTYVVNYMKNNVFSGEEERGYGVSDNVKLTNLICRNKEGILGKAPDDFLYEAKYDVYRIDKSPEEVSKLLESYIGQFVEEGFLYETLFGKKMYTYDQIMTESEAHPVLDYYKGMELFENVTMNYLKGKSNDKEYLVSNENSIIGADIGNSEDKGCICYMNIVNGKYRLESVEVPELAIESDKYMDDNSSEKRFLESLLMEVKTNGQI